MNTEQKNVIATPRENESDVPDAPGSPTGSGVPAVSGGGCTAAELLAQDSAGAAMDDNKATSRLERIMGAGAVERLASCTVAVLGLGGVGSNCVEALARGGVGGFVLVDRDVVEKSNINRQAIALHSTLGERKIDACEALVRDINPQARVRTIHRLVVSDELEALLNEIGEVDYVVDAIDSIAVKLKLAEYAQERGFNLVSAMGGANKLYPESFKFADVHETVNCPLCRIMRKEARKRGIRHLDVLYSCEKPVPVPVAEGATRTDRSNLGTASYIPPIMGQMIAGRVIRKLVGLKEWNEQ